ALPSVDTEAGDEVLVLASGGARFVDEDSHHFVASPSRAIPRAVEGREGVACILRRKHRAAVESHLQRRRMWLEDHVGHRHLAREVGPLPLAPRILVVSEIPPGPPIERALLHAGDIVGNQIVAEAVALVRRAPELARGRVDGNAHAVAQAGGECLAPLALWIEDQDVGTALLVVPGRSEAVLCLPRAELVRRFL